MSAEPTDPTILPDRYVRTRRPEEGKYRNSGWVSALFVVLALIGWASPWHEDPPVTRECAPITQQAGRDPAAYDALIAQGYRSEGHTLTPPGCEGQR